MATVLYVDDEEAIRRAVVTWLTRRGHTVFAAPTIAVARELLASEPIEGVFIDLWLGEESGLELQAWIDENRPELSMNIVFVTGDIAADGSATDRPGTLGRPVLGKPFDLKQLDEWVTKWEGEGQAKGKGHRAKPRE
jgi:DNA-binding NtrC family response regulator